MKKLIALLLAVCMVLGLMTTVFAADEKSNDIVILYTNDVHCAVDDNIGYAGLAAYKKEMQAAYNYVALVDCGDSVQGDVIGTLSKGEYLVDIMNELGYDFASFGNHEFDYTLPQLQKLIDDMTAQMGAAARELKFELAGRLRDEIYDLKKELRGMEEAGLE